MAKLTLPNRSWENQGFVKATTLMGKNSKGRQSIKTDSSHQVHPKEGLAVLLSVDSQHTPWPALKSENIDQDKVRETIKKDIHSERQEADKPSPQERLEKQFNLSQKTFYLILLTIILIFALRFINNNATSHEKLPSKRDEGFTM